MMNLKKILILLIVSLLIYGCEGNMSEPVVTQESKVKLEIGSLDKLISLPKTPISVRWELNESSNSDN